MAKSPNPRALPTAVLGAVLILALGWTGMRLFSSHRTTAPPPPTESSPSQTPGAAAPVTPDVWKPVSTVLPAKSSGSDLATVPSALHEVIPEVPQSARRTISGHIKVWVRVAIAQAIKQVTQQLQQIQQQLSAATADRIGPSRYFEGQAIEAAKKWTFPPTDAQSRRVMQIRFDFSPDGTTGRAVTLH